MEKTKKYFLAVSFVAILAFFVVGQIFLWQGLSLNAKADDAESIQDDISDLQKKLEKEKKAQEKLQQNLGQIKQSVNLVQKDINKTQSVIKDASQNINRKEEEVSNLNNQISLQKELLKNFIQQVYYNQNQPILNVVLVSNDFSKLFSETDHFLTLGDKIQEIAQQISDNVGQLEQDKAELAEMKQAHEDILDDKVDQKEDLVADQVVVQKSVAEKQKSIDKLNKELSQLQGDLNTLLGKSYSAKNIMDAVEFASEKTGVPKGFLIGVLKMETNLGANVGGCTYAQVEDGAEASYKAKKLGKTAWNTFLNRRDTFKKITDELDLDYRKQKVSCNPKGYTGTGGAMGVAQFMPDTWMAYKSQVTTYTGNKPPSPWNLGDGVMAMALKLGRVPGVTDGKKSAFKSAACSYLGTCYAPYINGILYWADNYKDLIN